jgi:hypothetical protein
MADALVYESETGFTKRYAENISLKTGIRAYNAKEALKYVKPKSKIVYMGYLTAGSIKGLKKARSRYDIELICAVGISPYEDGLLEHIKNANHIFTTDVMYLRGGYAPDKVRGMRKIMIEVMKSAVRSRVKNGQDTNEMPEVFLKGADFVSDEYSDPVAERILGTEVII